MADQSEPLYVNDELTESTKSTVVSTENKRNITVQTLINSVSGGGGNCRVYIDTTNVPEELWGTDANWLNLLEFDLVNTGDPAYSELMSILNNTESISFPGIWLRVRIVLGVGTTEADVAVYWAWDTQV